MQITNYAQLMHYVYNNTAYSNAVKEGRQDLANAMVRFVVADYDNLRILQKQWGSHIQSCELAEYLIDDLQHGLQILEDCRIAV